MAKKNTRPKARISKDNLVRAARMFDPDFFKSLKGDDRKVAVLTLERGFLPIVRNCHFAVDAICEMCREAKGEKYSPMSCIKNCELMQAVEKMEELTPLLSRAIAKFHPPKKNDGGDTDGGTPLIKGSDKTGPKGGGDTEDRHDLVPA